MNLLPCGCKEMRIGGPGAASNMTGAKCRFSSPRGAVTKCFLEEEKPPAPRSELERGQVRAQTNLSAAL